MIWKSKFGIEIFNGDACLRFPETPVISDYIKTTMASINDKYLNKIFGAYNNKEGKYYMSIPTGSNKEPDKVVLLDYLKGSFDLYQFAQKATFFETLHDDNEKSVFVVGTENGNIWKHPSGYTDDGTKISANFKMAWHNITTKEELCNEIVKMFIKYILPVNKTITMKVYIDFLKTVEGEISLAGSSPVADGMGTGLRHEILHREDFGIRASHVLFEFINNEDTGGECRILGWNNHYKEDVYKRTVKGD